MNYLSILSIIETGMELLGVSVIAWGIVMGITRAVRSIGKETGKHIYTHVQEEIGRSILLGLEILIAVDIVRTVTTELSFESTINLGLIVLIRILLSITLQVEIENKFPWQPDTPRRPLERTAISQRSIQSEK